MEHMNESFILHFTQENQDSKFVAQMLAVANVIFSKNIKSSILENTNSTSKKRVERSCFSTP
jgi:hypothetical protein